MITALILPLVHDLPSLQRAWKTRPHRSRARRRALRIALGGLMLLALAAPAAALSPPVSRSEQQAIKRDLARLYREQGAPAMAVTTLLEALALGESAELRIELGQSYFELGEAQAAAAQLHRAAALLAADPLTDFRRLEQLAYVERLAGLLPEAETHYRALTARFPERPELWLQLGHVQLSLAAAPLSDPPPATDPTGIPDSETDRARLRARGSYGQALARYRRTGQAPPPELAFALRATGAMIPAEELFVELLAREPGRSDYLLELAALRLLSAPEPDPGFPPGPDQPSARASARELLGRVRPADLSPDQLRQLADAWRRLQEPARAAAVLAPLVDRGESEVLLDYADALRLSGQPAAEAYSLAYARLQTGEARLSPARLRALAYGLRLSGRPAQALDVLARLASPTPGDAFEQGLALQALGRRDEAIAAFRRAGADPARAEAALYQLSLLQAWEPVLALLESQPSLQTTRSDLLRLRALGALGREQALAEALAKLAPLPPSALLQALDTLPEARWLPQLTALARRLPEDDPLTPLVRARLALRSAPTPEQARPLVRAAYARRQSYGPDQQRLLAELLLATQAWPEAGHGIADLLRAAPEDLPALSLQARLLGLGLDRRAEGLALLDRLTARPALSPPDRLMLAESYHQLRDWRASRDLSESVLATMPDQPAALLLRAQNDRELGLYERAAGGYAQLLARQPDHADAALGLGLVRRAQDRRLEAAASFAAAGQDPRLGETAETLTRSLFRERMALDAHTDYSPLLGLSRNDFFLRGAYTSYLLAETRHRLSRRLDAPLAGLLGPGQPDWHLDLDLADSGFFGQSATWLDFNRFAAGAGLHMDWRPDAENPATWSLTPSLSYRQSSVLSAPFRQIVSTSLGLEAAWTPLQSLRLSAAGNLSLGEPDLLLGSFEQGGAQAQVEYFLPGLRLGLLSGLRDYLLYDGAGTLQRVQRYANTLLIDGETERWIYRGRFDLSPIRGDFADLNLNLDQSLRWLFTPELSAVAGLELHKYFNPLQRNQSVASLQAGLAWRLPLAANLPLYLEARARVNSFFDVGEPLRPGFLLFLRSEL